MATIIDGSKISQEILDEVASEVITLKNSGISPGLAVIIVGQDGPSQVYVRNKRAACKRVGIESFEHALPAASDERELLSLIDKLNADASVHGILVQLPLPSHINGGKVLEHISPSKDIDGFHPVNVGNLILGRQGLRPCTPSGIMKLIDSTGMNPKGARAVIVGRSNIVGKPTAIMLLERHSTVTICHSRTRDLGAEVKSADIVVAAIGKPKFIRGDWIKPGAVVIDVGINRLPDGKLVGDVDFEQARKNASAITPVPGGVGPMTIAMLLKNTVEAAKRLAIS